MCVCVCVCVCLCVRVYMCGKGHGRANAAAHTGRARPPAAVNRLPPRRRALPRPSPPPPAGRLRDTCTIAPGYALSSEYNMHGPPPWLRLHFVNLMHVNPPPTHTHTYTQIWAIATAILGIVMVGWFMGAVAAYMGGTGGMEVGGREGGFGGRG